MSVQLTVRVNHSEYGIRCPDVTHFRIEDGMNYVVMPSLFEADEPDELLWLSDVVLIERARAGSWELSPIAETRREETDGRAKHHQPPVVLNGHKLLDRRSLTHTKHAPSQAETTVAGTGRVRKTS